MNARSGAGPGVAMGYGARAGAARGGSGVMGRGVMPVMAEKLPAPDGVKAAGVPRAGSPGARPRAACGVAGTVASTDIGARARMSSEDTSFSSGSSSCGVEAVRSGVGARTRPSSRGGGKGGEGSGDARTDGGRRGEPVPGVERPADPPGLGAALRWSAMLGRCLSLRGYGYMESMLRLAGKVRTYSATSSTSSSSENTTCRHEQRVFGADINDHAKVPLAGTLEQSPASKRTASASASPRSSCWTWRSSWHVRELADIICTRV